MTTAAEQPSLEEFAPGTFRFYQHALRIMTASRVPYLVGGAYGFACYTGIARHTKDLDLFVRRQDIDATLAAFRAGGYKAEIVFAHWLGKAYHDGDFVDIIFNSGNGACPADDSWFEHAVPGIVLGHHVQLMPVEEMIWQKAYIMERERYELSGTPTMTATLIPAKPALDRPPRRFPGPKTRLAIALALVLTLALRRGGQG